MFRREFMRELLNFLRDSDGDAFYLVGPTGAGKTSGVTEALARLNWPCQQITAHGRIELADLIGQFKLVSKAPGEAPEMEFVYGVLPTAMKYGHVLLVNELDYADPSEISGLNDVIEGRPLVITENGGEVIKPHPMFRLIATGNSAGGGDDSGLYRGVMAQNIAFMDRFRVSVVGYIDPDSEEAILGEKVPKMPKKLRQKLIEVANAIRTQFLGESGTGADGNLSITMSTRTLVRWAKLAFDFRQHPTPLQYALGMALTNKAERSEKVAIEKIAAGILGDQWAPSNS
ncbi:MAG: AAA domain-containing protein [gamma proteobacterium symbiont of Clathrolucina costata]